MRIVQIWRTFRQMVSATLLSVQVFFVEAATDSYAEAKGMSENLCMMGEIVNAILTTGELDGDKWDEFTIVFEFDDEGEVNGSYGYSYERAVEANAFAVDPDDVSPQVNVYCEFMRIKGDKGMIKMLFQFNRVTRKVNADFEYENPSRWKVTPKNIDTIVEELRPNLW